MRPRNEALDCRVYAMSAFTLLNADLNQIMEKQKKSHSQMNHKVNQSRLKHYARKGNFAKSWNN